MLLLHPASLFLSAYQGHADPVHTFFVLLAMTLILLRRPELGWAAAALACMMKPLAAAYLPLLVLVTLMRSGLARSITAALSSWLTIAIVLAPYWLTGRGTLVMSRLFGDIDLLPNTTLGAHNLWWLLTGPWQPADQELLGPLTGRHLGLCLFGVCYAAILAWVWRAERGSQPRPREAPLPGRAADLYQDRHWFLALAATGFSFFAFSTHLHENHLFLVLPLLIVFSGWGRRWLWLYGIVGASILINMMNHDLLIGELVLSKVGGPTELFDQTIAWYKSLGEELTRTAYLSRLEVWIAYTNSLVTLACWGLLVVWGYREIAKPRQ